MIRNRKLNKGDRGGFTLLELLIAITLLATGFLAAAAMQSAAMNANSRANRISVATMVGQQVVEELSSLTVSDPLLHTAVTNATYSRLFDPVAQTATASMVSLTGAGTFSATYDIAPDTPIAGTTQITVRVFYQGSAEPVVFYSTYKKVV